MLKLRYQLTGTTQRAHKHTRSHTHTQKAATGRADQNYQGGRGRGGERRGYPKPLCSLQVETD